jgi:small subunit ribosomal protein S1
MTIDEFSIGDLDENMDFGAMLEGGGNDLKRGFNPGEKINGIVTTITANSILLDINAKSEGIIDRSQFETEDGLSIRTGDSVEAYFVGMEHGEIALTTKMKSQDVDRAELQNAYQAGIPVEGKVTGENKAGLEITIGGVRGFCPASQIDTRHVEDLSIFKGQVLTFMVLEMSEYNLVLSRRRYLEQKQAEQKGQLKERLSEGDVVSGNITKIMDFGVFVDLGGVDGLIPIGELAWERVKDPTEYANIGERVSVKVIKLDWDRDRITLSLKQAGSDPWDSIETELRTGIPYTGTVTRISSFGAFVELRPGIEGLLHISKLGRGRRLSHPREVVDEGQEIEVFVESVDLDQRRISLAVEREEKKTDSEEDDQGEELLAIGGKRTGTVEDHKAYGAFIKLTPKKTGLIHISEFRDDIGGASPITFLQKNYPVGSELEVVIKDMRDNRISLTLPGKKEDAAELKQMLTEQKKDSEGFGSLGGLFDNL